MKKSNPYKRDLLDWLLRFAYPEDSAIPVFAQGDEYPHTEALRAAVIDMLRARIGRRVFKQESIQVINRALNDEVWLVPWYLGSGEPSFGEKTSLGRTVSKTLLDYFNQPGDIGSICEKCDKVFLATRQPKQRFCSDRCRSDFWNGGDYKAKKMRASREHKKRVANVKGGKQK